MRSMLIALALCGAVPALASEFPPEIGSFAYAAGASSAAVPYDTAAALPTPKTAAPAPTAADPQLLSKRELCSTVAFEAATNKLPVRFFANLIEQESSFRLHVVSSKGALGIAQFMPGTAAEQGLSDPFEPIQALSASAKFLAYLLERFGNLGLAAAAYNAGPQRVSDWLARQGSLPAETQHYVRRITGLAVEEWARPGSQGDDIRLPPHAECPQFRAAASDPLVNTKMAAASDAGNLRRPGRRVSGAYARPRLSALTYVTLSPAVAKSPPNDFTKGAFASIRHRLRLARGAKLSR